MFESAGLLTRATTIAGGALAVLMGFGFPTGVRMAMAHDPRPTPWFWGINGAGGVLGSVMAVICSITFGIATTIAIGGLCYMALIPAAMLLGIPLRRFSPASGGA